MLVMLEVTNPVERAPAMAKSGGKNAGFDLKELLSADGDFLRALMDVAVQAVLEAEMTEALSAEKSARVEGRQGYRSSYYRRSLPPGSGRWSCVSHATARGCFPQPCLSVTSVRRRRW